MHTVYQTDRASQLSLSTYFHAVENKNGRIIKGGFEPLEIMNECGKCHGPVPDERSLFTVMGYCFCSDKCEREYLNIFDRWLKTATERRHESIPV